MPLPLGAIVSGASKLLGTANPLGALGALGGVALGIGQGIKAKSLERKNIMPMTTTNENILKNVGLAEQMARGGLPQRVYLNQLNQLNTGLNTGLRQASRMGGLQNINSTLRAYGSGVDSLNARDAQSQQANQGILMQQRGVLANEEQRVFDWNKAQPYMRMSQRIADLRSAGTQNIFGGIGALSGQNRTATDTLDSPSNQARVSPVNNTMQSLGFPSSLNTRGGIVNSTLQGRGMPSGVGQRGVGFPSYIQSQLKNSLNTGYGMNPYSPNA